MTFHWRDIKGEQNSWIKIKYIENDNSVIEIDDGLPL